MEAKSLRGGKRDNAGRKPLSNPKKQVTLYVPKNSFYKFGNEDKMKDKIYDFIETYGEAIVPVDQLKVFDSPPLHTNYFKDEPKQWIEPKINSKTFAQYLNIKRELDFEQEFIDFYNEVDNDSNLTDKQKQAIKLAK